MFRSEEVRHLCTTLVGCWLRDMIRHPHERGKPWHEWGLASTRAARTDARKLGFESLRGAVCSKCTSGLAILNVVVGSRSQTCMAEWLGPLRPNTTCDQEPRLQLHSQDC